jgi:hypothetical protein
MRRVREMPEELKGVGEAVQAMARRGEASWRRTRGGRAVDYATIERQGAAGAAAIERASPHAGLQGVDLDQPRVVIEGQGSRRGGRDEAGSSTLAGPVRVTRALDRGQGQRTAKPGNAVSWRRGAGAAEWLPAPAQARAPQRPQGTARAAAIPAQGLGR